MKKTPITLRPGTISREKLATVSPISPKEMMAARLEALPIAANSLEDTKANLVQDLHDFQMGSKPLSSELVNCLEAQLALLLKNKLNLNSSGPDFDPDPPPGGAAALPVPTESSYTVVRMSA
jgi:hypothetical protein